MKIACLAWGSLLWKTEQLVTVSAWRPDGPRLPVEFARVSDKGELSTALCEGAALQSTWWALLAAESLAEAREQLRQRESVDPRHPEWIGSLPADERQVSPFADPIGSWMRTQVLDAVVWTALPPRIFDQDGRCPTPREAVEYLQGLQGSVRTHAKHYVRQVPASLSSDNRRAIDAALGWHAADA